MKRVCRNAVYTSANVNLQLIVNHASNYAILGVKLSARRKIDLAIELRDYIF